MDTKQAGKIGGDKTKATHGRDFYVKIRSKRKNYPKGRKKESK